MTINSLPADLAAFVEAAVSTGRYDSPEAVFVAGLQSLRDRDEELRREIQKGLDDFDRGDYIEIGSEKEMREYFEGIKRRFQERSQTEKAG